MKIPSNKHVEALRKLGRILPKEQMYVLFDAANEIITLEGRLISEIADLTKRESHWFLEMSAQMKRADDLYLKLKAE